MVTESDTCVVNCDNRRVGDITTWPDGWLITAIRGNAPDIAALDELAARYWNALYGRCYLLSLNRERANDLSQEAWCRVLRARNALKPDGNFPGYLMTIATNLWRDAHRSARRAGPLAEHRLASLDAALPGDSEETIALGDVLPDLNTPDGNDQKLLAMDIDRALERLTPHLRDVLVARFISGESCAEIGRRYHRTEQTVSAWVREGIRIMKVEMEEPVAAGQEVRGSNVVYEN